MSRAAILPLPVFKEARALAPSWLVCTVAMIIPVAIGRPGLLAAVSGFAYFLGASSLGALSIGHEYTHGTLGLLLCLPARRQRLLFVKLGVLAVMLLALWIVAYAFVFRAEVAMTALPVGCAFFLAPWLTMACRSQIAGTLSTMAIPAGLMVGGDLLGNGPGKDPLKTAIFWQGMIGLCAVGAFAGWRLFMRLEAIDGPGQDLRLPAWLTWRTAGHAAVRPSTKRNPVWMLVKKELRLQVMPLLVAGLYLLLWLAVVLSNVFGRDVNEAFSLLTWFYVGLVALLVGSLASAGERELGTLSWQLLMPLRSSSQWAVKVAVAVSLALCLGLGLPAVCTAFASAPDSTPFLRLEAAVAVALLTTSSLYISSVCTSSFRALMLSFPTVLGLLIALPSVTRPSRLLALLAATGCVALFLRFAFVNHRLADQSVRRVGTQLLTIVALVEAVVILARSGAFHN